jgi:hypothetical protein
MGPLKILFQALGVPESTAEVAATPSNMLETNSDIRLASIVDSSLGQNVSPIHPAELAPMFQNYRDTMGLDATPEVEPSPEQLGALK